MKSLVAMLLLVAGCAAAGTVVKVRDEKITLAAPLVIRPLAEVTGLKFRRGTDGNKQPRLVCAGYITTDLSGKRAFLIRVSVFVVHKPTFPARRVAMLYARVVTPEPGKRTKFYLAGEGEIPTGRLVYAVRVTPLPIP